MRVCVCVGVCACVECVCVFVGVFSIPQAATGQHFYRVRESTAAAAAPQSDALLMSSSAI